MCEKVLVDISVMGINIIDVMLGEGFGDWCVGVVWMLCVVDVMVLL